MRIGFNFHTADNYISGVEYYSLGLLRSLLSIDGENQYIVFTNKPGLVESHTGSAENLTIRDCSFLKSRLQRILWEHLKLTKLAAKEKLDILHFPHYICPAKSNLVPYVITIHDTIAIDHPSWCKISNAVYYNVSMKSAIRASAKIIAVSKFTLDRINRNFEVNGSKVKVIYPGLETIFNPSQDIERQRQVRAKYKLPGKYILYAGNIEPKKNILNLLRAFKLLKNKDLKHSLVLTGKRTWKSKNVWSYIRSEFGPKDVRLTGYVDRCDLGFVYKMADCFVLPSFCEGFGFPALEASACGVPVAVSCVGIMKELDEKAYTCIDPESPEQIAESVQRLLTDQKIRENQTKIALAEVQKFNWHDCATKTLALYREVVESNG